MVASYAIFESSSGWNIKSSSLIELFTAHHDDMAFTSLDVNVVFLICLADKSQLLKIKHEMFGLTLRGCIVAVQVAVEADR